MFRHPGAARLYASGTSSPFQLLTSDESASDAAANLGRTAQQLVHLVEVEHESACDTPSTETHSHGN